MDTNDRSSRPSIRGLLILNAALLGVLAVVSVGPSVGAQADRMRGDFTMVAGGVNGSDADAVYIIDTTNQRMIAATYERNNNRMQGIGFRDLAADAAELARSPVRPGN